MPEITTAEVVDFIAEQEIRSTIEHAAMVLQYDYLQQRKDVDAAAEAYWANRPNSLEDEHRTGAHRRLMDEPRYADCASCAGDRLTRGISRFSKRLDFLWK